MTIENLKEHYHLWWEYLKRSEKYRKFCEKFNQFCEKEKLPITASDRTLISLYVLFQLESETIPKELKEFAESRFYPNMVTFGDVFSYSFDKWFEMHKKRLNYLEDTFSPVQSYSECFEDDFVRCVGDFVSQNDREPTMEEFKDVFKQYLESAETTIKINMGSRNTNAELVKKCGNFIKKKRKHLKPTGFNVELFMKSHTAPTSRVRLDKLKRYLSVYDLYKEGKSIDEIINLIGDDDQKENFDFPEVRRVFWRDLQKAKEIIKNVEKGFFPRRPDR
jgi:hypothetical protein